MNTNKFVSSLFSYKNKFTTLLLWPISVLLLVYLGLSIPWSDQFRIIGGILAILGFLSFFGYIGFWLILYPILSLREKYKKEKIGFVSGFMKDSDRVNTGLIEASKLLLKLLGFFIGIIAILIIWNWIYNSLYGERNDCISAYKYENINKIPAYCIKYFK